MLKKNKSDEVLLVLTSSSVYLLYAHLTQSGIKSEEEWGVRQIRN